MVPSLSFIRYKKIQKREASRKTGFYVLGDWVDGKRNKGRTGDKLSFRNAESETRAGRAVGDFQWSGVQSLKPRKVFTETWIWKSSDYLSIAVKPREWRTSRGPRSEP